MFNSRFLFTFLALLLCLVPVLPGWDKEGDER